MALTQSHSRTVPVPGAHRYSCGLPCESSAHSTWVERRFACWRPGPAQGEVAGLAVGPALVDSEAVRKPGSVTAGARSLVLRLAPATALCPMWIPNVPRRRRCDFAKAPRLGTIPMRLVRFRRARVRPEAAPKNVPGRPCRGSCLSSCVRRGTAWEWLCQPHAVPRPCRLSRIESRHSPVSSGQPIRC